MEMSMFYIDSYRQNFYKSSCVKLEAQAFDIWYVASSKLFFM